MPDDLKETILDIVEASLEAQLRPAAPPSRAGPPAPARRAAGWAVPGGPGV